jgi:hypothetical protein
MTLSYDSSRERDRDQVFRALAPDRFYPIYGDSSTQGYAVEGQGKFSLRVDQPRSSFALGDSPRGDGEAIRYDRSPPEVGRPEMKVLARSFGATAPTQVREQTGRNSSPYRLTQRPLVIGARRVVRRRATGSAERVLSARAVSRFANFDVDYGRTLFFNRPFGDEIQSVIVVAIMRHGLRR